jgi:hypothetical protein
MTAEHVNIPEPRHPLPALTTYELAHYRSDLEHAVEASPGHAAMSALLRTKLTEVLAEQQSRTRIATASR